MEGIFVGVDESPFALAALRWAVDDAATTDQLVTAVLAWGYIDQHHVTPGRPFDPGYSAAIADKVLEDLVIRAVGTADGVARRTVCDLAAPALLDASADAALLVVGARGMGGFRGLLLGSVSRRVLHQATCPVAVVRDVATRHGEPVIVGIDGSGPSHRALVWAVEHARTHRVPLVAVHAWHVPYAAGSIATPWPDQAELAGDADRFLHHQLEQVDTSGLIAPVELRTVPGRPTAALLDAAALASLVVVGSRGHGQLANALLGSTSDQVAHHATCPVVVVP
jgi:nucleotide-binding universal stress UspA family protein